jgi:hypothetical protein
MVSGTSFKVEVTEDVTIARDSFVEHVEHGSMIVDRVVNTPDGKQVELKSPVGNLSITLSEDKLREQWGEQMGRDWTQLY